MRCNSVIPRDATGQITYAPPKTDNPQPGYWSKPENKINANQNANVKGDSITCPGCGKPLPTTVKKCLHCGATIQAQQPIYNQVYNSNQAQADINNPNLIPCPACGNMMSKQAAACPVCGNPRQKKVANPVGLDIIAMLAIVICIFAYMAQAVIFSYGVMLVLMIIYWAYYSSIKDNPDIDASKVKQSLNVITILFIIMFCIGFVVIM